MDTRLIPHTDQPSAIVWLDRRHALIARAHGGHSVVTEVERDADPEGQYLLRIAREAADCDRVVISGPDATRIDFEREYVALYRRPDRLIDLGVSFQPERRDLVEQLAMLESSLVSH